jgi:hypothetical protein
MPEVCTTTALSEIASLRAIAALVSPWAMSAEDLAAPRGHPVQRLVVAAGTSHHQRDDLGVHCGAAVRDPAYASAELGDVEHALLEQVAHAGGTVPDELGGVAALHELGEHQYRRLGSGRPDPQHGTQAVVGVRRRHPDVEEHRPAAAAATCATLLLEAPAVNFQASTRGQFSPVADRGPVGRPE